MFNLIYSPVHDLDGCHLCGRQGHAIISDVYGLPIVVCEGIIGDEVWLVSERGHFCGMDRDTLDRRAVASGT
jgi:hypothetical protein